jgi:hypothetical protein
MLAGDCAPGVAGKEKTSSWEGMEGATLNGDPLASLKKYADEPGIAGVDVEA